MEPIVGIDLGTTNSEVAIVRDGQPHVFAEDGDPILPSFVGLSEDGRLLVGKAARNQWVLAPERTIKSIKRKMGQDVKVKLGDQEYRPQEISAMILRALRDRAGRQLGQPVNKAVITVPAYFNDAQRQATREAGELAGLEVVRILNEPTAASLTYDPSHARAAPHARLRPRRRHLRRLDRPGPGGRRRGAGQPRRHAARRRRLRRPAAQARLRPASRQEHGIDLRANLVAKARRAAGRRGGQAPPVVPPLRPHRGGVHRREGRPGPAPQRGDQPRGVRGADPAAAGPDDGLRAAGPGRCPPDRLARSTRSCWSAAARGRRWSAQIAGGAARPAGPPGGQPRPVRGHGRGHPGGHHRRRRRRRRAGGHHAALAGHQVPGRDRAASSFRYRFAPIIHRNTPLPASRSEMFHTVHDRQTEVEIDVYQGESDDVRHNHRVGRFLDPGAGAGAGRQPDRGAARPEPRRHAQGVGPRERPPACRSR